MYSVDESVESESFNEDELLVDLNDQYKSNVVESNFPSFTPDMSNVRSKTFKMTPITLADAVLCLEFIQHPFYVFRNKDTNDINVVYKRNDGGVGHIQPE